MSRHERATALFLKVVDLGPEARCAVLDETCGDDEGLRREVESLLAEDDRRWSLLDTGSMVRRANTALDSNPDRIGPYVIEERLGSGGMGVVYRARKESPIRRHVAIKLIKLGLDTEPVLRRFDTERRVLELLDHPGIARVLDAGATEGGRPYFVMELVDGQSITAYCDRARLTLGQRLRLFLRMCDAVEHAHQNGVIHRDLKPSNVLIQEVSGRPVPKVIDFGIAKALERDLGTGTLTEAGQLIGTLAYMSPEQASLAPGLIDTRADVYSLGAILYELLTGCPPLSGLRAKSSGPTGIAEACRRVQEEDPLLPSRRLALGGGARDEVAAARGSRPGTLERQVRGDLDCIVAKALEKNRARRYDSVSALAADLRRHQSAEPIEARPHSGLYRLGKLLKKHPTVSIVTAVLLPLLVAFAVTMFVQAGRIARERDRAEEISNFLVGFYDAPFFVVQRHGRPTANQVLTHSAEKVDSLRDRPLLRARLRLQMGLVLSALGLTDRAEELLEAAHATLTEKVGADDELTIRALHGLALARWAREAPGVEEMMLEALAARKRTLGPGHRETLRAMIDLAHFYKRAHRFEAALQALEECVRRAESTLGREDLETMTAAGLLASVRMDVGLIDEAAELLEDLVPRFTEGSPEAYIAAYNLASVHAIRGDRDEAFRYLALSIERGWAAGIRADPAWSNYLDDPEFIELALRCELQYGLIREGIERAAEIHQYRGDYLRAVRLRRAVLDSGTLSEWERSRWNLALADAYLGLGEYEQAEEIATARLAYLEELPDSAVEQAQTYWYLVQARLGAGKTDAALEALDRYEESWRDRMAGATRAAILGDEAVAFAELEEAIRHGFAGSERLRRDLAFADLRDTERFRGLLREIEARTWASTDLRLDMFVSVREMPPVGMPSTLSR